jgi:Arc/MetJ-type ribon-helix-helix transcriptional regulator
MSTKTVTRSVRIDQELDDRIERLAADRGVTVSAFIRTALTEIDDRDERRRKLERAMSVAAQLPEVDLERDEMWGIGTRVPR